MSTKNIAVIHTRLKCIDGVSVEADKWIRIYQNLGFNVFLIAGSICEKTSLPSLMMPEIDFIHENARETKRIAFEENLNREELDHLRKSLKEKADYISSLIKDFIKKNNIRLLSIENALSIPLNIPFGIALKEIIGELNIAAILRHHDFYWEREYFCQKKNIQDILDDVFPPKLRHVKHVTINHAAYRSLLERRGIKSEIIHNSVEFDRIHDLDDYNRDFRKSFGINDNDIVFLQPTRIIRRKCIERSIRLVAEVKKLTKRRCVLMITGPQFYSEGPYYDYVVQLKDELGVETMIEHERIRIERDTINGEKVYSIHDAYLNADVITFPSDLEGFGDPVLEAAAYKKPLFVNRYPVFKGDLEPYGFDFITINGKLTDNVIKKTYNLITDEELRNSITAKNYEIAKKNFSAEHVADKLNKIIKDLSECQQT